MAELNTYHVKIGAGVNLVASTGLVDPNFIMSVVLICHHGEDGSFGLILNRPTTLFIDPATLRLQNDRRRDGDFRVHLGGPVQPEALFFLYRNDRELPDSQEILPGVHLSSSPETLKALRATRPLTPGDIRFYIGYAGWSFYQLDCEASSDAWFAHPAHAGHVFSGPDENLWLGVLGEIGEGFRRQGQEFIDSFKEDGR